MKSILPLVFASVLGMLFSGCERSQPSQRSNTRGIVALSPAVAIILRELDCEKDITGRHGFDLVLKPELPVCGDQTGLNYEKLLAVGPTHIVTEWGIGGPPEKLLSLCQQRNWLLHDAILRTPDDIVREVEVIGAFVGADPPRIRAIIDRTLSAWSKDESLSSKGRVLMLADIAQPAALGPGSFHHDILLRIGIVPALVEGGPYQYLSLERIKEINPDVIVLVLPRAPMEAPSSSNGEELVRALGRIADLDLSCVRNRRIVLIDDPGALTPSTAMIGFAETLKSALRGLP